jgi:hypothetical protein
LGGFSIFGILDVGIILVLEYFQIGSVIVNLDIILFKFTDLHMEFSVTDVVDESSHASAITLAWMNPSFSTSESCRHVDLSQRRSFYARTSPTTFSRIPDGGVISRFCICAYFGTKQENSPNFRVCPLADH